VTKPHSYAEDQLVLQPAFGVLAEPDRAGAGHRRG